MDYQFLFRPLIATLGQYHLLRSPDTKETDPQTRPCHLNSPANPILTSVDYLHLWSWQYTHFSHILAYNTGQRQLTKMRHRGGGTEKMAPLSTDRTEQEPLHLTCMLASITNQGCCKAVSAAFGCIYLAAFIWLQPNSSTH